LKRYIKINYKFNFTPGEIQIVIEKKKGIKAITLYEDHSKKFCDLPCSSWDVSCMYLYLYNSV